MKNLNILGISAYYHDAAACLIRDGKILAAVQEERFTRKKHDASFPHKAITYCLKEGNLTPSKIDHIVFYEKPFLKFERLLETYLAFAPRGLKSFTTALPLWLKDKLFQKATLAREFKNLLGGRIDWKKRLLFSEHHLSHAASAFFPSPFTHAAVLTLDGVGEWTTTSLAIGNKQELKVYKEIYFPHSLGLLYSAITFYTGFKVNSGEYKVMGLAPYGRPQYVKKIKDHLIDIKEDGSFALNMDYFNYCTGLTMVNKKFERLFEGPPRTAESPVTQKEMDLAASIQVVFEEVMLKLAKDIAKTTGEKNLCLAGGGGLNCVANGKLFKENIFQNLWIQPAAGDSGGALGRLGLSYYVGASSKKRALNSLDSMQGAYLGPQYSKEEIEKELTQCSAVFHIHAEDEMIALTATTLAAGKAIGWFQGRMEFGPRALGNRSILADPRSPFMQKQLNLKVKYRESFRPFAPSVLREDTSEWFATNADGPYMLLCFDVKHAKRKEISESYKALFGIDQLNVPRSSIPAVTHVDYSARVQTVDRETNPLYHKLLRKFKELTNCPVLVNTSFNVRGEPIVCSPTDAFRCFMGTELDILVVGNNILNKSEQSPKLSAKYSVHKSKYELD